MSTKMMTWAPRTPVSHKRTVLPAWLFWSFTAFQFAAWTVLQSYSAYQRDAGANSGFIVGWWAAIDLAVFAVYVVRRLTVRER